VSSSGYGDGRYELFCQCRKNYRIALMIVFDESDADVGSVTEELIKEVANTPKRQSSCLAAQI